ncbi:MAG TPA: 16S rRNA (cytosine(967)-C(5))-methyltransferase RsmB [Thermodesulfovibrionales bacterium]|nr:16S rRNA (cytosine(967)-C(5))-methyltransferase RsmB [Thermodesulfovibrionales bacterium]
MHTTRELALKALSEIWRNGRKPKEAIELISIPLDDRERSFLMELVYGVLRYRDTLDWALKDFLKKPAALNNRTLNNLRLAAYQILFMRVPEWAAVNEAVEIEKKKGSPELINAVLRNLLRRPPAERINLDDARKKGAAAYISRLTSHPEWLVRRWIRRFGETAAKDLAVSNNRIPPLTLRVNTLKSTRDRMITKLGDMGIHGEPTAFSPEGIRLGDFHLLKEFSGLRDSLIVQDEAAQLVAHLLGPQPGDRVLDACSAPGGKTTHIAQLMQDRGEVVAVDNNEERIKKLRENVFNLNLKSIKIVCGDVADIGKAGYNLFDSILLDAPCSSIGVIRRNPDIKYRHRSQDIHRFKLKQVGLLRSVSELLRPGGTLVYSVCSTEPEEGEEVIKEFLKDSKDFYIIETVLPFLKVFMKNGFFRTYPHTNDLDGFFGVKLCKRV